MDEAVARHADLVAARRWAVFESAGETDPAIRQAAGAGGPVPDPWGLRYARQECRTTLSSMRST